MSAIHYSTLILAMYLISCYSLLLVYGKPTEGDQSSQVAQPTHSGKETSVNLTGSLKDRHASSGDPKPSLKQVDQMSPVIEKDDEKAKDAKKPNDQKVEDVKTTAEKKVEEAKKPDDKKVEEAKKPNDKKDVEEKKVEEKVEEAKKPDEKKDVEAEKAEGKIEEMKKPNNKKDVEEKKVEEKVEEAEKPDQKKDDYEYLSEVKRMKIAEEFKENIVADAKLRAMDAFDVRKHSQVHKWPKISFQMMLLITATIILIVIFIWKRFWYTICTICQPRATGGHDRRSHVAFKPL